MSADRSSALAAPRPAPLATAASAALWLREQGAIRLTTDSRRITAADALIAWPGASSDARPFIPNALASGAVAALMEADNAPQALLDNARVRTYAGLKAASGAIAAAFYGHPSEQLALVAFTGTNGKTSSSWWLAQALSGLPAPHTLLCAIVGTLGTGMLGQIISNGLTTPDPVLLQGRLQAFVDQGCKAVALEASSIGLAEGRLNGTQIHTAVFTNFTQDHLDYHGSMEAYWQAKAVLLDWPGLRALVLNLDDEYGQAALRRARPAAIDVWTYSTLHPARLMAQRIRMGAQGLTFDVVETAPDNSSTSCTLQTALIGNYNVSNLLGVIAAMRSLGVALALCAEACKAITPVPGRLEVVSKAHEPLTVIDYAHSPDALEKVLLTLRETTQARGGKLWCVFGCGGERDTSKRPMMGAIASRFADQAVVTSDNPRGENPNAIVAQILLGMEDNKGIQVQVDRALAIQETVAQAAAGDVIVITGKGHEDYQEIMGNKTPFSDQAHARAALAQRAGAASKVQPS